MVLVPRGPAQPHIARPTRDRASLGMFPERALHIRVAESLVVFRESVRRCVVHNESDPSRSHA